MAKLNELDVSKRLIEYFTSVGLTSLGKMDAFDHADDISERSFEIDLAIGPCGTKGNRTDQEIAKDLALFEKHSEKIDSVIRDLNEVSLFPQKHDSIKNWVRQPNPNPVFGIAIEIENNLSKYFLGSLLAAAIAGRWGILIIPEKLDAFRWIETLHRMMHKGAQSPIPSNVSIFSWPALKNKIDKC